MSIQPNRVVESQQIELASRPTGVPSQANFQLTTAELSPIADGEFLVRNEWMSVDPYMRGRMREGDSYVAAFNLNEPLEGGCIGQIVASRHEKFQVGDYVLGTLGWREYWKSNGKGVTVVDPHLAPVQAYLGVLGMTGLTAWVGLNRVAKLQSGMTVFVSAASGAVGSIVCQLAKAKKCRVIGSAGAAHKIEWLRKNTNVDAVINYNDATDITSELAKHAPNGVDVYFDNVGGNHLEAAIDVMNDFGCCVECGMISTYNVTEPSAAPRNLMQVIVKRIRMQGFIVTDHLDARTEFFQEMSSLIQADQVVWEETVTEGLANAPTAFIGLFEGSNLGKQLVRI